MINNKILKQKPNSPMKKYLSNQAIVTNNINTPNTKKRDSGISTNQNNFNVNAYLNKSPEENLNAKLANMKRCSSANKLGIDQQSNPNSNNASPSVIMTNKSNNGNVTPFDLNDLVFNINDDYKTVISKNNKLRALVVQASTKLNDLNKKYKNLEEEHKSEKEGILNELDKISTNYKMYAESHKNYTSFEEQFKNLQKDYHHNYKVLTSYQENLSIFLKDYMDLFRLIGNYLNEKYNRDNPLTFLADIKDYIIENLEKYKETIDVLNFKDIYDEVRILYLIQISIINLFQIKKF